VQEMFAGNGRRRLPGRKGQRTDSGKAVTNIGRREAGVGKEPRKTLEKIIQLFRAGLRIVRLVGIGHLTGSDK